MQNLIGTKAKEAEIFIKNIFISFFCVVFGISTLLSHGTKFHLHYTIYEYSKILTFINFPGTRMNVEHESVCLDKIILTLRELKLHRMRG